MTNVFLAPLCILAGGIAVLMGLIPLIHARTAAAVAAATFLFGGRYESIGPVAIAWPLYLNMPLLAFALAVAVVVGVMG
jgi:hypothetical protein